MIMEALKRIFIGLGFSNVLVFGTLTVMMMTNTEVAVPILWENILGSMIMGAFFGAASLLFEIEKWSPLKQTMIHFILSISLWLFLATLVGWLPLTPVAVLVSISSFILVYLIFWLSFYLYFKRVEKEMNRSVK
ncbi:DUF3021 domain-containing protein [Halalkalibacter okhensis]|uniref:DUF3021 domain-containing protein n=1 Tax=Halalkalibacter okhensis TaxID=333138 RepID=A0A0B0INM9_9BACI|nr:DUF3021 domain-containing protein [Halalkalibacter okhensis]KHF41689.1 hypothetical protein LQ50_03030 [Halalkalibacter okhensis]